MKRLFQQNDTTERCSQLTSYTQTTLSISVKVRHFVCLVWPWTIDYCFNKLGGFFFFFKGNFKSFHCKLMNYFSRFRKYNNKKDPFFTLYKQIPQPSLHEAYFFLQLFFNVNSFNKKSPDINYLEKWRCKLNYRKHVSMITNRLSQ